MGEIFSSQRGLSLITSVLVVQATPAHSTEQDGNAESDCPSSCSQMESSKNEDRLPRTDTVRNDSDSIDKNHIYPTNASSYDRSVHLSPTCEHRDPFDTTIHEFGTPRPPDKYIDYTPGSPKLKKNMCRYTSNADSLSLQNVPAIGEPNQLLSDNFGSLSINHVNENHLTRNTWQEANSFRTLSTLSTDDLSVDARACRPPGHQRNVENDGGQSKTESNLDRSIEFEKLEAKEKDENKEKLNGSKSRRYTRSEMEAIVRQFVAKEANQQQKPQIIMFDAAVVYDKSDYDEVLKFREELIAIVKNDLGEDLQIELFDSERFAQSKIMVIEDVINKCSIVLIYLTENCTSETFKLFCEEGIGISRLGLNNPDIQAGRISNDKQWIMRPVHTQPMKHRRYHTPVGLVTVNGIDWYDKLSTFTRNKIKCIMKNAIDRRKRNAVVEDTSPSYAYVPPVTQTNSVVDGYQVISNTGNSNISTNRPVHQGIHMAQYHSLASVDAHSFPNQHQSVPYQNAWMTASPEMVQQYPILAQSYPIPMPSVGVPQFDQQYMNTSPAPYQHQQYGTQYQQYQNQPYMPPSSVPYNALPAIPQEPRLNGYPSRSFERYMVNNQMQNQRVPPSFAPTNPYLPAHNIAQTSAYPPAYVQQPYVPTQRQNSGIVHPNIALQTPTPPPLPSLHTSPQNCQMNRSDLLAGHSVQRPNNQQPQMHCDGFPSNSHQIPCQQRRFNSDNNATSFENNGNFMRDQRNDALPTSELEVVSRVNGNLIVNPNLSTDDIEIDNSSYIDQREGSKSNYGADASSDSDDSSDDGDEDLISLPVPSHKGSRPRGKTVNIVKCANVQLGKGNKIVEHKKQKKTKKSLSASKQTITENKTENSIGNRSTPILEAQKRHTATSTPEQCQTGNSKRGQNTSIYKDNLSSVTNKPTDSQTKTVFEAVQDDKENHFSTEKTIPERRFVQKTKHAKTPLTVNVSQRHSFDSKENETLNISDDDNDAYPSDNFDEQELFGNGSQMAKANDRNSSSSFGFSRRKKESTSFVNSAYRGFQGESSSAKQNCDSDLD